MIYRPGEGPNTNPPEDEQARFVVGFPTDHGLVTVEGPMTFWLDQAQVRFLQRALGYDPGPLLSRWAWLHLVASWLDHATEEAA